ncbi:MULTISPECIES: hypothetical protein [Paraburkholderia]|uniref:hypothetical protein n=1 Tax=Paraburkholderia TaxID=1822464 RepID=UPI0038B81A7A
MALIASGVQRQSFRGETLLLTHGAIQVMRPGSRPIWEGRSTERSTTSQAGLRPTSFHYLAACVRTMPSLQ